MSTQLITLSFSHKNISKNSC